jgi:alpha-tubulin suppressor-like RCC1 family protein
LYIFQALISIAEADLYVTGANFLGQLGNGTRVDVSSLTPLPQFSALRAFQPNDLRLVAVSPGGAHTCFLLKNGLVLSAGRNAEGQLGRGRVLDPTLPLPVSSLKAFRIVKVACGATHTLALDDSALVFAWGCGAHGRLGIGSTRSTSSPALVDALSDRGVRLISAGWAHSAAATGCGIAYTWGCGANGRMGHGDESDAWVPRVVDALRAARVAVRAVSLGFEHSLFLADDGGVMYSCGWFAHGQLGRTVCDDHMRPVKVTLRADFGDITAIAAGGPLPHLSLGLTL